VAAAIVAVAPAAGAPQPGALARRWRLEPGDLAVIALLVTLPLNKVYWDVGLRIRPWYLLAPIALVAAYRQASGRGRIPGPVWLLSVGMWIVCFGALATGLWAIDTGAWFRNVGDLLLGAVVAATIALSGIGPGRAQRMVGWWIAIGVGMSLYGLLQFVAGTFAGFDIDRVTVDLVSIGLRRSGLDEYGSYLRVTSLIEDSSKYSVYLCTVWPFLLFRVFWAQVTQGQRRVLVGALGLVSLNLLLTLSRSGLIGALAGLLVAAVLVFRVSEADRRRRNAARRALGRRPARLAIAVATATLGVGIVLRSTVLSILDLRTQSSEGTQLHFDALRDSLGLTFSQPWGVGLGGFTRWFQLNRRPWEPAQWSSFNSYTEVGASAGLIPLLAYIGMLVGLGIFLWRLAGRAGQRAVDASGALVALVAVAVGAVGYDVFATGYFVGFLGLVAAVASSSDEPVSAEVGADER
jgi:hypothetical protein